MPYSTIMMITKCIYPFVFSWYSGSLLILFGLPVSAVFRSFYTRCTLVHGICFFCYFLYSLYYHFFRNEFEPMVLVLIAVIIVIVLVFIVDIIVSTLRLLSAQTIDLSVLLITVAYPILDAIIVFPAVLVFWAVRRISSKRISSHPKQKRQTQKKTKHILLPFLCLPFGYCYSLFQ
jgi:hypothetical protein